MNMFGTGAYNWDDSSLLKVWNSSKSDFMKKAITKIDIKYKV